MPRLARPRSRLVGNSRAAFPTTVGSGHVSSTATTTSLLPRAAAVFAAATRVDSMLGSRNRRRQLAGGAGSDRPPGPPHVWALAETTYQFGVAASTWNSVD